MSLNARYVFAELKCVSGLLSAWILASPKIWNDPQWHWIPGMQVKKPADSSQVYGCCCLTL